jgi:hypothetical protein
MTSVVDHPLIIFLASFIVLLLSAYVGAFWRQRRGPLKEAEKADHSIIEGTALTLLSLLIGFTFSMAMSRYEQRKNYEEAEANAIGTEYVRAGLLPDTEAAKVREDLRNYLDQRLLFYTTREEQQLQRIDSDTTRLQKDLWSVVQARALTQPTSSTSLAAAGMNDVLNSEGYTQAAWWNRIPTEAWILLAAIAIGTALLIGNGVHRPSGLFLVISLGASLCFFLIADIDSPRTGLIRVQPENLIRLSDSLRAP